MSEIVKVELITKIKYKGEEHNLQELFNYLVEQLEQKENIIKEVREYVEKCSILGVNEVVSYCMDYDVKDDLLQILDKVGDNNE